MAYYALSTNIERKNIMPRKFPLEKEVKARISTILDLKLKAFCATNDCSESEALRLALKKFLKNTATEC